MKLVPIYKSETSKEVVNLEINGSVKKSFVLVPGDNITLNENILGRRIIMAVKNPNYDPKRYKDRFIVQVHGDTEKEHLIHIPKYVRICNVYILVTLSAILNFEI